MTSQLRFITFSLGLIASAYSAFAQIPNAGFETWTDDCTLDDWFNNTVCGLIVPVTKTTQSHSGNFAVRGEVVNVFGQNFSPLVQSGATAEGTPISQRYTGFTGHYRFAPVGGDRFGFNIAFYKGDAVIAQGAALFPATAGTAYAPAAVTMNYTSADIPDRAIIQAQIIGPITGSDFHVGSVMYIDDLAFSGGGGSPTPNVSLTTVLNPDGTVTVSWPAGTTGYHLEQSPSLASGSWTTVSPLNADGHSYTLTPNAIAYFRLVAP